MLKQDKKTKLSRNIFRSLFSKYISTRPRGNKIKYIAFGWAKQIDSQKKIDKQTRNLFAKDFRVFFSNVA